jgi:tripartite-type tricarboxylate transporter receptor subunit TctC
MGIVPTRRSVLLGGVVAPLAARMAAGQISSWPSGPIRIVVPFAAGGSIDMIARVVQPGLQQRLGNVIIVDNRPGASGSAGAAFVAKSPPDGTTWLLCFDSQAINPFLVPNLPFDTEKDLDPVLLIGTGPHVICTHPSRPYRSFADVVADAQRRPDVITISNGGAGSAAHLTATMLAKRAGVRLVHVPYRGGGPSLNDAVAGHVDLISGTVAAVSGQVSAGALRPLLQTGLSRLPNLPDVPTADEFGFKGFEALTWWGCFGPSGVPKRSATALPMHLRTRCAIRRSIGNCPRRSRSSLISAAAIACEVSWRRRCGLGVLWSAKMTSRPNSRVAAHL